MSNVRIEYVLNGVEHSRTIPAYQIHSELNVMKRHRARITQLVTGSSTPSSVLADLRDVSRTQRIGLTLTVVGV
jgi:hypothetical protein